MLYLLNKNVLVVEIESLSPIENKKGKME